MRGSPLSSQADSPAASGDASFTGVPDAFGRLWTPHRLAYIQGAGRPTGSGADEGCPFCVVPTLSDEDGLIVARGSLVYAVLNLYPYNSGHVLVVPYRHLADYGDLTAEETAEFSHFTKRAMGALRAASSPHGFNVGMNLGTVAGAGIAAHLHQHVVPRWGGDTNFMPVVGRTRVLPQLLADTRKILADAWPAPSAPLRKRPRNLALGCGIPRPLADRPAPRYAGRESVATFAARWEGSGSCRR